MITDDPLPIHSGISYTCLISSNFAYQNPLRIATLMKFLILPIFWSLSCPHLSNNLLFNFLTILIIRNLVLTTTYD